MRIQYEPLRLPRSAFSSLSFLSRKDSTPGRGSNPYFSWGYTMSKVREKK